MSVLNSDRIRCRDGMGKMIKILASQRRGIKICHINAQSLRPKIEEFRIIFESSGLDVVCVSETWLKPELVDALILLQGYNVKRADRNGYGGVAIYVREGIPIKVVSKSTSDVVTGTNGPGGLVEYLLLEICCEGRKLLIGCVYRPNNRICMRNFMDTTTTRCVIRGGYHCG